ncbi:endoglucanase E-4-like [Oratosquilla oratoria]|uniref:endoglucanase E-4-like n=1 Tax=Oratosquilla oratoria TaxID=337810 RepID=UPI003F75EBCA
MAPPNQGGKLPTFKVVPSAGYDTAFEVVRALEKGPPSAMLERLNPEDKKHLLVVHDYPTSYMTEAIEDHPQVICATRMRRWDKTPTRQVLITIKGEPFNKIDLGMYGRYDVNTHKLHINNSNVIIFSLTAGDYVKFGFPFASTATVLAWGAIENRKTYEAAGEWDHMKEAVKWATDYFIKAHVSPFIFYGQVGLGDLDHAYWGRPEDMTMERPALKITKEKPGSELAGETAAALAAASILFMDSDPSYANDCLQHAKELYKFADSYRGTYSDSIPDAGKFYKSWNGYGDELAWAALWLYRATYDNSYLIKAVGHYEEFDLGETPNEFSWDEKTPGVQVLLYQLTNKVVYKRAITDFCDSIVYSKPRTPKGLVYISQWGSLRYASNAVFVCLRAAAQGIKPEIYRDLAKEQIHYILGDTGRSFVVGFGHNPPQRPHHASSSCPSAPASCDWSNFNSPEPNAHVLEGALVGGPDKNDFYEDKRDDYIKNEVTCDYNAGFQSAVAELRSLFCI